MAIKEIRAALDLDATYDFTDSETGVYKVYNKRVNLTEFNRHTIKTVQMFHNTFDLKVEQGSNQEVVRHTFISTYPISFYSANSDAIGYRVPNASDENIHYRETEVFSVSLNGIQTRTYHEVFPTEELAYTTNLSLYTPFVYITVMYLVPDFDTSDVLSYDPSVSLYMVVDEKPVGDVEYSMGIIGERESASWAQIEGSGATIAENVDGIAGNVFPLYSQGGQRTQGMMAYNKLVGNNSVYFKLNNLQAESMDSPTNFRSDARTASTMVPYNEEFGGTRNTVFYPDWLAQLLRAIPAVEARISTRVIPKRYLSDGTTEMFTP